MTYILTDGPTIEFKVTSYHDIMNANVIKCQDIKVILRALLTLI